jgi:hypothetical protein
MNPIDSQLSEGETVIYQAESHWAMLLGPAFVLIIGGLSLQSQGLSAAALMVFGLAWGFLAYHSMQRSRIVLTGDRLLVDAGFPLPKSFNIALNEIVAIDYYQPSLGSMLNFGKIMIVYKGKKSRLIIRFITAPAELVTKVRQRIAAILEPPQE